MTPHQNDPVVDAMFARVRQTWRAPTRLSLSAWSEKYFRLSSETAAEPGRWHALPYQVEILDAITDPAVEIITLKKSARIGYTLMISAAIAYFIEHEPSSMLVVQPTGNDAKGFSKETIMPMMRDVPVLTQIALAESEEKGPKGASATIAHKSFPGGVLSLIGANSGTGFRRISRRVVMFDEVDAYPLSAGNEGDPIELGMKRAEYFWDRKIIAGSTPLIAGVSRIEQLYEEGDRRRFYVPCPTCGHMDFLRFNVLRDDDESADAGHLMKWEKDKPETACFMCRACGCAIEEKDKRAMLERGEWRAEEGRTFTGHASFHIWAAYSVSPNATWASIVKRFLQAKGNPLKLQTFVNTDLAETWKERGEALDWQRLQDRAEDYEPGTVPLEAQWLTCGVDVQQDRFMFEIVGWKANKESFSVAAGMILGDTALESTWNKLDEQLLDRTFTREDGLVMSILKLAIDSGYRTQMTYSWARRHPLSRVIACKGVTGSRALVGQASPIDVKENGKVMRRAYRIFPIGVDIAKSELYAWLAMRRKVGEPAAGGYCHFPAHPEEYFQQLTAEQLVTVINKRTRRRSLIWQVQPNRENHYLDCRILARVAIAVLGLDQLPPDAPPTSSPPPAPAPAAPAPTPAQPAAAAPRSESKFFGQPRGDSWFGRRR